MNNGVKEDHNGAGVKHSKIIRGPYQLSIDITNKCNLRCLHCYNSSGSNCVIDDEMSDEEFLALIDDVASLKPLSICLCGGEPLLRKSLLLKAIRRLSDAGVNTAMVSNGMLLDAETAKQLKDAGLRQIQISLDGMKASHDRLRNMDGSFEKAVQAIKNVTELKLITGVAFVPTRWNIDEIEDVYELARQHGVTEVRIQYLMEIGRGNENKDSIGPTPAQYRKLLKKINEIKNRCANMNYRTTLDWGDPIDHLIRFSEDSFACCTYFSIRANGAIVPSMYLPISVGNTRKNSFSKYWEGGLTRVWRIKLLKEIALKIRSVSEMSNFNMDDFPLTFQDKDIEVDILTEDYSKEVGIE